MRTPWHQTPEARALLASIRQNPPRLVERLAPLSGWLRGGFETEWVHDPNDERIEALSRMSDAAFLAAEARGKRARTMFMKGPRVCEVVAAAVAGNVRRAA